MTSARVLSDGHYRVVAPRFSCGVHVVKGRLMPGQLSPLRRLGNLDATAFFYYAQGHGWKVEPVEETNAVEDVERGV